jgi:predicted dehydrogenase
MALDNVPELGIGIAGFGFIGKVHANGFRNLQLFYDPPPATCRMVGVCTSRQETAEKARQVGGFEFGTTRFEELLERDDIHVIDVATPNNFHRDQVIAALEAGKHVYCDKPLTVSLQDAGAIVEAARARPRLSHGMAFQCRFIPGTMRARQLVEQGFLGRVYHFRAAYLHSGYADPTRPVTWRLESGSGCLADLGSHIVDLMRYLLGDYDAVRGTTQTWVTERPSAADPSRMLPVEVDDYVCLEARMKSGAFGLLEASRYATGTQDQVEFQVYGDKGALKWDMMDSNWLYAYDAAAPGGDLGGMQGFTQIATVQKYPPPHALPSSKQNVGWMRYHMHSIFDFLTAVTGGGLGTATLYDGAHAQAVDHAIHTSVQTGDWETVPEL